MLWAMVQEHERAAGAWQAETETILELLRLAGSAAAALRETLTGLHVDVEQMRANLEVTGGLTMSESVATALGPVLGRRAAHQLVQRVARRSQEEGRSFRELLLDQPEVVEGVGARGIEDALDPRHYLGVSEELISRTLRAHSCH
jgi:3-carboxy-cis,cis-muconate cycloisomerase